MKLVAGLSFLGLLLALAWVLIGQLEQAERALEPATTLAETETAARPDLSPVQGARDVASQQAVAHLLETLQLDYLSAGGRMSPSDMLASLRRAGQEVGVEVAAEPREGAVVFRRLGPSRLALCDQATGNWHCQAADLDSRGRADAYGGSLMVATRAAAQLLP